MPGILLASQAVCHTPDKTHTFRSSPASLWPDGRASVDKQSRSAADQRDKTALHGREGFELPPSTPERVSNATI